MRRSRLQWDTERRRRTRRMMDEARAVLLERTGGRCEGNDFSPHCTGVATDAHHIWPSDRDRGTHDADRMAYLCRWCHQEVHANPALANRAGLLKRDGED